jgi:hypothetical protein
MPRPAERRAGDSRRGHRPESARRWSPVQSSATAASSSRTRVTVRRAPEIARWTTFTPVLRPVDLAGPRWNGSLVLAAGRLFVLGAAGRITALPRAEATAAPEGRSLHRPLSGGCYGSTLSMPCGCPSTAGWFRSARAPGSPGRPAAGVWADRWNHLRRERRLRPQAARHEQRGAS